MSIGAGRASVIAHPGSRRTLLIALALIAVLFATQGLISHQLTSSIEERSWRIERASILSVEQLARIARDLERERILIDDHIMETDPTRMADIERARDEILVDLSHAEEDYAPLAELPEESAEWQHVSALIGQFHAALGDLLTLSRMNQNDVARAKWKIVRSDYTKLESGLSRLMEINRTAALDSVARIQSAEQSEDDITDAIMVVALVGIALTGLWSSRRIRSYEEQLESYSEGLKAQNRDLDAFAGRVAHDLRNAMGTIVLSPMLLRRAAENPEKVLAIADRLERSSQRTTGMLEGLLAFSRAGSDVDGAETGSLRSVLADVVEEVGPAALQNHVTLETSEVPDLVVRCDARLLHVVLANLVGNAVKYLEGQPERRVRLVAEPDGAACRIEIADTGPGIPKHAQEKIFEPFFRVEGATAEGTGLGLATVRRIVDGRGGRIVVESAEGRGSRFSVWLPLARSAREDGPCQRASRAMAYRDDFSP